MRKMQVICMKCSTFYLSGRKHANKFIKNIKSDNII